MLDDRHAKRLAFESILRCLRQRTLGESDSSGCYERTGDVERLHGDFESLSWLTNNVLGRDSFIEQREVSSVLRSEDDMNLQYVLKVDNPSVRATLAEVYKLRVDAVAGKETCERKDGRERERRLA